MVAKHFSFTSLKVVFFPRAYECVNHEGLRMFCMRGMARKIDPHTLRKWKPFLLITYPPPSTLHFSKDYFFGRKKIMNACKCHTTCLLQPHLIILVSNGERDSFCLCSGFINASMLVRVQALSLIDLGVE